MTLSESCTRVRARFRSVVTHPLGVVWMAELTETAGDERR